jgi:GPI mannosyltransferase 3
MLVSFLKHDELSSVCVSRSIASIAIAIVDSLYYGQATFTPLNFLRTNLSSVSLFYGTNPWHYYLSQGLPVLCTTTLPFVVHGLWLLFQQRSLPSKPKKEGPKPAAGMVLTGLIVWTVGIYSVAGHKEWRFLHPLLPLLHICAAKSVVDLHSTARSLNTASPNKSVLGSEDATHPRLLSPTLLLIMHLTLFLFPAVYLVLFHGRAQIAVMYYLRSLPTTDSLDPAALRSLGFLMPCHSVPWQAYLHREDLKDPGQMWAIGCEPPLA